MNTLAGTGTLVRLMLRRNRWLLAVWILFLGLYPLLMLAQEAVNPTAADRLAYVATMAGRTWQPLSLEGEADFHALEVAGDRVYGVDSQTGLLKTTTDGKQWRDLGQLPALDVAADPDDAKRLLLTDGRASLVELEVAGQPRLVESAPQLVLLDWVTPDLLAGVGPEGAVHRSPDGGESWQETGSLPEPPPAFTATEDRWYAATEAQILSPTMRGRPGRRSGSSRHPGSVSRSSWPHCRSPRRCRPSHGPVAVPGR